MSRITLCAFADEAAPDFEGQIAALLQNGIPYIELRHVDGKNVVELTECEAGEYKKRLDRAGLAVWSIGSPLGKSEIDEPFEAVEGRLKHLCRLAGVLGTDKLRIFSFYHAQERPREVIERLRRMVEIARGFGVTLCHENEKEIFGDTVARVQTLLDSVPGLGQVFDPANFLQLGEDVEAAMRLLHSRADYFHIKDVALDGGELVPAGFGDGRIAELVARVKGDALLSIEPHLKIFDGFSHIDGSEMRHKFSFSSNREAFDAAVRAVKAILAEQGYLPNERSFVK